MSATTLATRASLCLLLFGPRALASPDPEVTRLHGRVAEFGSGRSLQGATLLVDDAAVPLQPDGTFEVRVPVGRHAIVVEVDDAHVPLSWEGEVVAGQDALMLYVERQTWEEFVVYGAPLPHEAAAQRFSAAELARVPGAFGDPIRALQSLPSVARPATIEGTIVARGAEGINTATSIDGIPVPYLYHFLVGRSVVDPTLLDRVDFYPGGMPSRYGRATQALVDAQTLEGKPSRGLHGRIRADLMDGSFATEGRLGRDWVFAAAGRTAWLGPVLSFGGRLFGAAAKEPFLSVGYSDYLVRIGRTGRRSRVVLTGLGVVDLLRLRKPGEAPPPPVVQSGYHRLHLRWDADLDRLEHTAWLAGGPEHQLSQLDQLSRLGDTVDRAEIESWSGIAHLDERLALTRWLHLELGGEGILQRAAVTDLANLHLQEDPTELPQPVEATWASAAGYAESQLSVGGLYLAAGGRLTTYRIGDDLVVEPEPRLTARQVLTPTWTVKGFVGRFSQIAPPDRFLRGDWSARSAVMTAWQAVIGAEARWSSGFELEADVYGARIDRTLVRDLALVPLPDPPTVDHLAGFSVPAFSTFISTYRPATARAYGAEVLLRLRPRGTWSGWVSASVGRSRRDGDLPADYELPWSLSATVVSRLRRDWVASGKLTTTAGYPFTPQLQVARPNATGGNYYDGLSGAPNSARFPPFVQLDLRLEKTWTMPRARWTTSLDLYNALNIPNPILVEYDWSHSRLVRRSYLPFVPNLGLAVDF